MDHLLGKRYKYKVMGTLGFDEGDSRHITVLNRTFSVGEDEASKYIDI